MTTSGNGEGSTLVDRLTSLDRASAAWRWVNGQLNQPDHLALLLRATLVLVALHTDGRAHIPVIALAAAGLILPQLLRVGVYWLLLAGVRAGLMLPNEWALIDNHEYLITYWCAAIGLALVSIDPVRALRASARLLIVVAFGFATLWKVISPDFLDGSFFEFTFVTDPRFDQVVDVVGGLTAEEHASNDLAREALQDPDLTDQVVALSSGSNLRTLASALSWWTLAIEAAVVLAFVMPRNRIGRWRDVVLLAFIGTTYAAAPVFGFGWLLLVMGLAQVDPERARTRAVYVGAFLLLPVFTVAALPAATSVLRSLTG